MSLSQGDHIARQAEEYARRRAAFLAEQRAAFTAIDPRAFIDAPGRHPLPLVDGSLEDLLRRLREVRELTSRSVLGFPVEVSDLVPPGELWIVDHHDGELHRDRAHGYDYLRVQRIAYYNPRDALGYPFAPLERHPLYTRRTLGAREAARDWRRHGRPGLRRRLPRPPHTTSTAAPGGSR